MPWPSADPAPRLARVIVVLACAALASSQVFRAVSRSSGQLPGMFLVVTATVAVLVLQFRYVASRPWAVRSGRLEFGRLGFGRLSIVQALLCVAAGLPFGPTAGLTSIAVAALLLATLVSTVHAARVSLAAVAVSAERLRIAASNDAAEVVSMTRQSLASARTAATDLRSLSLAPETASAKVLLTAVGIESSVHVGHLEPLGGAGTVLAAVLRGAVTEVVRQGSAEGLGFHVGDRVALTLPDGVPVTLTVVALYGRGLGFGDFVLDRDLLAANVDVPLDDELLVSAPSVARDTLVTALKAAAEPGVAVTDQATANATAATSVSTDVGYTMLGLILTFTGIAVLNTFAVTVMQRSREFTALRLAGATRGQVLGMLRWESAATMLIGAALGSAVGIGVLVAYAQGMTGSDAPSIALSQYLAIIGGSAVLVVIATWLPARIALAKRA